MDDSGQVAVQAGQEILPPKIDLPQLPKNLTCPLQGHYLLSLVANSVV
jgi:hypothetical protein